jgi:hypothetical protein
MNWTVLVAFCIIDDLLKTLGHKDDPQRKTPARVVYWPPSSSPASTNTPWPVPKRRVSVPSRSRFCRRLHSLSDWIPLLLP